MKKIITAVTALAIVMTMTSCGESISSVSSKAETTTAVKSPTVQAQAEEKTEETGTAVVGIPEEDFIDLYGIKMYSPESDMGKERREGSRSSYVYDKDAGAYKELYIIQVTVGDDLPERPVSELPNDESILYWLDQEVHISMPLLPRRPVLQPISEETVEIMGKEFIKQKGIYHTEFIKEVYDFPYVAYFGLVDFPEKNAKNCPLMWMDMSEINDEDTWAQLEKRVDTTANTLCYIDGTSAAE